MSDRTHGGDGVAKEWNQNETVYYGICRCGWISPFLRYDELDALNDFANHINREVQSTTEEQQ